MSKRRAIEFSVSPRLTVYIRNVGPGLGVGRENVGEGDGPAAVGVGRSAT